jgi:hypothetical protein
MQLAEALDQTLEAEEAEERTEEGATGEAPAAEPLDEEQADPDPRGHLDEFDPEAFREADAEALTRISHILGVPLWWERTGTPRPLDFPVEASFVPTLEKTARAVQNRLPAEFGKWERISTAGIWVNKGGAHGAGRAFDWDRLVFENLEIAPRDLDHASSSVPKRQRYWAFAALCRSVCSYVLHGEYDADHRDHVHQDDSGTYPLQNRRSTVSLCQAVLNEIHGQSPRLVVDGSYGARTQAALRAALTRLRLPDDAAHPIVWQRFLRRSGRLGFTLSVGGQ